MTTDITMLQRLFTHARSQNGWREGTVSDDQLRAAYEIAKWGPTSMNAQPMRLVFLRSVAAKERLKPALAPGNVEKAMTAPVIAIIAFDTHFYTNLVRTFPHWPGAHDLFSNNPSGAKETAFRNGTLQAAYYMLALRSFELDVGPLSGFDAEKVDAEFFEQSSYRVNFICGTGSGDQTKILERLPRLKFDEVAHIL